MKKFTKAEIAKNLRVTAKGEFNKRDIKKLQDIKSNITPNEKIRFHGWAGSQSQYWRIENYFDISMLSNFCEFSKGNDGKGGVDSDFIIVSKKEFKKLQKRLAYFLVET